MSAYYFIGDCFIGQNYYPAGSFASTADETATSTIPNTLPIGWKPNAAVDPQNAAAATAFYNAGPQLFAGPVRAQFANVGVTAPVTYWTPTAGTSPTQWKLTGLGSSLAAISE